MDPRDSLTDVAAKAMNMVHRTVLWVSGGRLGSELGSMPVVELRHTGRKSGKVHSAMLTSPVHEDGTYVLVASKGGDDRDPEGSRNIVANPDVELVVGGQTLPVTAETVSGEERAELWEHIVGTYSGYAGYQKRTERTIPVVRCRPRA